MVDGRANRITRDRIPDPRRAVNASRGKDTCVRAKAGIDSMSGKEMAEAAVWPVFKSVR